MISVIIPTYNAEQWIGEAIDSVLRQTLADWELIIVDDGSTDQTADLCQGFVNSISRPIHYYEQPHKGVGAARNFGMDKAHGESVLFLDADDWLPRDALENLARTHHRHGGSLVVGGVLRRYLDHNKYYSPIRCNCEHQLLDRRSIRERVNQYLTTNLDHVVSHCWGRLYSRRVLAGLRIRFNERMRIGEDAEFNLHYLAALDKACIIRQPVYNFTIHDKGLGTAPIDAKSLLHDFSALQETVELYWSVDDDVKVFAWLQNLIMSQLVRTRNVTPLEEIRKLLASDLVQSTLKQRIK